jgi:hypothetical protein
MEALDMTIIECPWCDEPVETGDTPELECATCVVSLEFAPDPDPALAVAA